MVIFLVINSITRICYEANFIATVCIIYIYDKVYKCLQYLRKKSIEVSTDKL